MGSPLLLTIPDLDVGPIVNYQPWENNFQFTWEAPIVDLDNWQGVFLAAQEIKQQVEFLKNQVMNHYQELHSLNFRSDQSKKFGDFAIKWLLHLDGGIQELRTATSQAFGNVNRTVQQIGEGINQTRLNVQQNVDCIVSQGRGMQQGFEEVHTRINRLDKVMEQIQHTQDNLRSEFKKMTQGVEHTFKKFGEEITSLKGELGKIAKKK